TISWFVSSSPASGSVLTVQSLESASNSVSPALCPSPTHILSLWPRQTPMASSPRPKMDAVLTEAIKACFQKSGASVVAIRKYIMRKYPSLELERRGYLLKQALKRELNRGVIKQVKGKGASGSFIVVQKSRKTPQ
ncbi:HP1B3 protein, partial [Crocuta crocuta]